MNIEKAYFTKVSKIGDSHGIIIPVDILRGYGWRRGDTLVFGFVGNDKLYIRALSEKEIAAIKPLPDVQVS